jgi:hypothetical protein
MQLGTMSNMLRGLPMQASTTNMYQAAPNAITQGIGAVGAYGALNGAFGGTTGRKEGGVINAAKGGIMSYDVGGEIESTLSKMDVDDLKRYAKESNSPSIKQMAARLIQEKSMPVPRMARGGILAFAESTDENNQSLVKGEDSEAEKLRKYGGAPSYMYNPGEFLSKINPFRMMAERHAESFGTKPPAPPPAAAPAEAAPPPAALTSPSAITAVPTAGPPPAARAAPPVTTQTTQAAPGAITQAVPPAAPRPAPTGAGTRLPTAPAYPTQTKLSELPEESDMRRRATDAETLAKAPLSSFVEEEKAGLKAAGVDPENAKLQEYRSKIMAERANMDDEAKRQKNLRLAEFFASWGSTPGATLVAGMSALKKTIPTLIEDEKERKKALREADKIIYDLDQADRLEKKGLGERASGRKEQAATRAEKLNTEVARSAEARRRDEITDTGHKATYQTNIFNTQTQSILKQAEIAAHAANTAALRDQNDFSKAMGAYQIANDYVSKVRVAIDNAKADKTYTEAQNTIKNMSAVEKPVGPALKLLETAKATVAAKDKEFAERIREAEKMVSVAEARVRANDKGGAVLAGASDMSSQNKEALKWANEHPNDPRAAQIKAQLGK